MDWSVLIVVLVLLIIGGFCFFFVRRFVAKTEKAFHEHQPALRITNLSQMDTRDAITLRLELENVGGGVAYECVLHLTGWEGSFSVKSLYPNGPRFQRHAVPIVLGPDAPLRTKSLSRCYLRLAYRDCWEQRYECWYPVVQDNSVSAPLYDIQIDLSQPELTEPHPSFRKMRKLLRRSSTHE